LIGRRFESFDHGLRRRNVRRPRGVPSISRRRWTLARNVIAGPDLRAGVEARIGPLV
jgi:hypothetical protein